MQIQKILTVTSKEKEKLQASLPLLNNLITGTGKKFCEEMLCSECPFHNKSYACPIDTFNSNFILEDLEDFINQLTIVEED